jgi:cephalosporin hydroxylase
MGWDIHLPNKFKGLSTAYRKGRKPYDGFVRGYGIDKGKIEELCDKDKDFIDAVKVSWERTYLDKNNIMNLYMLLRFYLPNIAFGHIVEFGSYKGGSAIFLAHVANNFIPNVKVIGFDSFDGMPKTDPSIDAHFEGEFTDTSYNKLNEYVRNNNLNNLKFIKGKFEDTAENELKKIGPVSLVHIDCDIYSSITYCYEVVKKYLVSGAYIVFDDCLYAHCLGAFEAVEEHLIKRDGLHAEQNVPHLVYRYPANFSG